MRKAILFILLGIGLLLGPSEAVAQEFRFYTQKSITSGDYLPIVVRLFNSKGRIDTTLTTTVNLTSTTASFQKTAIRIVNGSGSVTTQVFAVSDFDISIVGYAGSTQVSIDADPGFTQVGGTIAQSQTWSKDQKYWVRSDLLVPNGVVLTIEAGTQVYLDNDINIRVNGGLFLMGTESELITFLPYRRSSTWGGIEFEAPQQVVNLNYAIFTGGGGDLSRKFGHSDSQPVLKVLSAVMLMDNCFFIDNEGKAIAIHDSNNTITNSLLSRCDTGAEFRYSTTKIDGLYTMFMPDEDDSIDDNDNDGLYFWSFSTSSPQTNDLNRIVIFGVEDDGIDFNKGPKAVIRNSVLYNVYDKGISASWECELEIYNTIFAYNGQGIGFKDETEVIMENCTFFKNEKAIKCFSSAIGRGEGELITKNLIFSQSLVEDIDVSNNGVITVKYSLSDTENHSGTGNITANPEFTDPENYNFSLTENSPAIDAGDPNDPLDSDGTRIDMGAIPFDISSVSPIALTEVSYRPMVDGVEQTDLEYIEILNDGDESQDLSGFSISGDVQLVFPPNTILQPGAYLLIAKNAGLWTSFGSNVIQWDSGILNNSVGVISFIDPNQEIIFSISFNSFYPWPTPTSFHNYPIELKDQVRGFKKPQNWQLSKQYGGTPGKRNVPASISGLVLNEFMARNSSFIKDESGSYFDWLEIVNSSSNHINIAGLLLSNDEDNVDKYQFPENNYDQTTLIPGQYLFLWASGETSRGSDHLNFTIPGGGAEIVLSEPLSAGFRTLDKVVYGDQTPDFSYGRIPNANGLWTKLEIPTPGTENIRPHDDVITGLHINELVARYGNTYPDEYGNYSDWIEIYNSSNRDVNLAGLYLSDILSDPLYHRISVRDPEKTIVPASGYLVFRADAMPDLGALHLNFQLASQGETITLSQDFNGTVFRLDEMSFGAQEIDISYGRAPDGSHNFEFFATPTPGARNSGSAVNNYFLQDNMEVYPNPATDTITIRIEGLKSPLSSLSLINLNGQVVKSFSISVAQADNFNWHTHQTVNDLENGIYYLHAVSEKGQFVKKIAILR